MQSSIWKIVTAVGIVGIGTLAVLEVQHRLQIARTGAPVAVLSPEQQAEFGERSVTPNADTDLDRLLQGAQEADSTFGADAALNEPAASDTLGAQAGAATLAVAPAVDTTVRRNQLLDGENPFGDSAATSTASEMPNLSMPAFTENSGTESSDTGIASAGEPKDATVRSASFTQDSPAETSSGTPSFTGETSTEEAGSPPAFSAIPEGPGEEPFVVAAPQAAPVNGASAQGSDNSSKSPNIMFFGDGTSSASPAGEQSLGSALNSENPVAGASAAVRTAAAANPGGTNQQTAFAQLTSDADLPTFDEPFVDDTAGQPAGAVPIPMPRVNEPNQPDPRRPVAQEEPSLDFFSDDSGAAPGAISSPAGSRIPTGAREGGDSRPGMANPAEPRQDIPSFQEPDSRGTSGRSNSDSGFDLPPFGSDLSNPDFGSGNPERPSRPGIDAPVMRAPSERIPSERREETRPATIPESGSNDFFGDDEPATIPPSGNPRSRTPDRTGRGPGEVDFPSLDSPGTTNRDGSEFPEPFNADDANTPDPEPGRRRDPGSGMDSGSIPRPRTPSGNPFEGEPGDRLPDVNIDPDPDLGRDLPPLSREPAGAVGDGGRSSEGESVGSTSVQTETLRPHVSIRKNAPETASVGVPLEYTIVVTNEGQSDAFDVVVEDQLGRGINLETTRPVADSFDRTTGKMSWQINELPAGDKREIVVRVNPASEGTMDGVATVRFKAQVKATTLITAPRLSMELTGPAEARVGDEVSFRFLVRNDGSGEAKSVILRSVLPAELRHAEGQDLEYEINSLMPREEREIILTVIASGKTTKTLKAEITSAGVATASAEAEIHIVGEQLSVERLGPERRYVNRSAQFKNIVTNNTNFEAVDAVVLEQVPDGMKFVSAPGGEYNPQTRVITWKLDRVAPGKQVLLDVELTPESAGQMETLVEVVENAGFRSRVTRTVAVEDLHNVSADISRMDGPIAVGEKFTFTITIDNRGTATANEVQLTVQVPPQILILAAGNKKQGIEARMARGNNIVVYNPIVKVEPNEVKTFQLMLQGQEAVRNGVVKAQLKYAEMQEPLVVSESVTVYSDNL